MSKHVIYRIRNVVNGKFYVGSAQDTAIRFRQHRRLLRAGKHHCKHLQNAWSKYGEDCFKFEVVEYVPVEDSLEQAEDRWLEQHFGTPSCYNSGRSSKAPWRGTKGLGISPMTGVKHTEETRDRIREKTLKQWRDADPRTGRKHSSEAVEKIRAKVHAALSEGRGGHFIPTEETRAKMSLALKGNTNAKGHIKTEEHRIKLSAAAKGNKNFLGKTHSEESKAKMGKAVKATSADGTATIYPRTTAIKEQLGVFLPTVLRSIRTGKPLAKGPYKGWRFEYV